MRKRKFGYLLLSMLVISGFAGTPGNLSISKSERKQAITHLKQTRNELIKISSNLSDNQVIFKPSTGACSIIERFSYIQTNEIRLWNLLFAELNKPAYPERKVNTSFNDREILNGLANRVITGRTMQTPAEERMSRKNINEVVQIIKASRPGQINYARITTEDLRGHSITIENETFDAYQVILLIAAYTADQIREIEKTMADPSFPGK